MALSRNDAEGGPRNTPTTLKFRSIQVASCRADLLYLSVGDEMDPLSSQDFRFVSFRAFCGQLFCMSPAKLRSRFSIQAESFSFCFRGRAPLGHYLVLKLAQRFIEIPP